MRTRLALSTILVALAAGCPRAGQNSGALVGNTTPSLVVDSETGMELLAVSTEPGDPLLFRLRSPQGEILEFVGEKDRQGQPRSLLSLRYFTGDGFGVTEIFLTADGLPERIVAADSSSAVLAWAEESVELSVLGPDGSTLGSETVPVVDPSAFRAFTAGSNGILRPDGSGSAKPYAFSKQRTEDEVLVHVSRCGLAYPAQDVQVHFWPDGRRFAAEPAGDGWYVARVPSDLRNSSDGWPGAGGTPSTVCEWLGLAMSAVCAAHSTIVQPQSEAICVALGAILDTIDIPSGEGVLIYSVCKRLESVLTMACLTLGAGFIPSSDAASLSAPSLAGVLCDLIVHGRPGDGTASQRPTTTYFASAVVDFYGILESETLPAPFDEANEFWPLEIDATADGEPRWKFDFIPEPPPYEGQPMVVTVELSCAHGRFVELAARGLNHDYADSIGYFRRTGELPPLTLLIPGASAGSQTRIELLIDQERHTFAQFTVQARDNGGGSGPEPGATGTSQGWGP